MMPVLTDIVIPSHAETSYLIEVDPVAFPATTDEELWWLVRGLWGVEIPWQQVCESHDKGTHGNTPFEAFADAYFARAPVSVWKASRGLGGKSFLLATLALTEMATLGATVTILGGSGQQSTRVHSAMTQAWDWHYAPTNLLAKVPNTYKTELTNGAWALVLMASQTSVRGEHPHRLRLDEVDEMKVTLLDAALGQPMRTADIESHTVMSSTWHNADGMLTEIYRRVDEGELKANCIEWCYKETLTGWLTDDQVQRTRDTVTSLMWRVEYEGQRPSGGAVAILPECVDAAFDSEYGEYAGDPGEYIELEKPRFPVTAAAPYVTGVDWAKEVDWTIISTYRTDTSPWRRVSWQRLGRQAWPTMVAALEERLSRYGGVALHDNTGLGDVIDDYIGADVKRQVTGINLTGNTRQAIFNEYISSVEAADMRGPRIKWAYDEHRNVSQNDLKGSGHPPDSLVADALCWHARNYATGDDSWGLL